MTITKPTAKPTPATTPTPSETIPVTTDAPPPAPTLPTPAPTTAKPTAKPSPKETEARKPAPQQPAKPAPSTTAPRKTEKPKPAPEAPAQREEKPQPAPAAPAPRQTEEPKPAPAPREPEKPNPAPTTPREPERPQTPPPAPAPAPATPAPTTTTLPPTPAPTTKAPRPTTTTAAPPEPGTPTPTTPSTTTPAGEPATDDEGTVNTAEAPPAPTRPTPGSTPAPTSKSTATPAPTPTSTSKTAAPLDTETIKNVIPAAPVQKRPQPADAEIAAAPVVRDPGAPIWASGIVAPRGDVKAALAAGKARSRPLDLVATELPGKSWTELAKAPAAAAARTDKLQTAWTLPLTTAGATVADTAAGKYDKQWKAIGTTVAALPQRPIVTIATPAKADPVQTRTAFRRAAALVKGAAPKAIIVWRAPIGTTPEAAAAAYPGDDVVEVIGLAVPSTRPWTATLSSPGGLTAWSDWAAAHSKRVGIQWGIQKTTNPSWIVNMREFVATSATQKRVAFEVATGAVTTKTPASETYKRLW